MVSKIIAVKALLLQKNKDGTFFLELTRSPETIYPLMGDLPGGVFENDHNESSTKIIRDVIQEQIGVQVKIEALFVVYEWKMFNFPSEYLYCVIVDSPEIIVTSSEYTDFCWIPLSKVHESSLFPSLKKIILQSQATINKVVDQYFNN